MHLQNVVPHQGQDSPFGVLFLEHHSHTVSSELLRFADSQEAQLTSVAPIETGCRALESNRGTFRQEKNLDG